VTAPGPYKVIGCGRYTLQFALQVAIDKYADHIPLERQVRNMSRQGLRIDSQTLWDQIDALAVHLEPTYDALRKYIVGADVIGADETWWRMMQKKANKRWYAWGITSHDACWYEIADSRSAKVAAKVLEGYEGTVLCDGYKALQDGVHRVAGDPACALLGACSTQVCRGRTELSHCLRAGPRQDRRALRDRGRAPAAR
jgi:transposase